MTSILLKAQILDENEQPLEMIRYNGTLYKRNDYLNYVLNTLQKGNKLNLYCLEDEATGKYVQIDHNCVELANDRDGKVYLKLKPLAAGTSLYRKSGETYAPATDTELGEVEKNMKDFNAYNEAIGYKFVRLGKMMEDIRHGKDPKEAFEKNVGTYGRYDGAAKYIDPREE